MDFLVWILLSNLGDVLSGNMLAAKEVMLLSKSERQLVEIFVQVMELNMLLKWSKIKKVFIQEIIYQKCIRWGICNKSSWMRWNWKSLGFKIDDATHFHGFGTYFKHTL